MKLSKQLILSVHNNNCPIIWLQNLFQTIYEEIEKHHNDCIPDRLKGFYEVISRTGKKNIRNIIIDYTLQDPIINDFIFDERDSTIEEDKYFNCPTFYANGKHVNDNGHFNFETVKKGINIYCNSENMCIHYTQINVFKIYLQKTHIKKSLTKMQCLKRNDCLSCAISIEVYDKCKVCFKPLEDNRYDSCSAKCQIMSIRKMIRNTIFRINTDDVNTMNFDDTNIIKMPFEAIYSKIGYWRNCKLYQEFKVFIGLCYNYPHIYNPALIYLTLEYLGITEPIDENYYSSYTYSDYVSKFHSSPMYMNMPITTYT